MQYRLYSIFDQITNLFNLPFTSINDNDAIRTVRMVQSDSSSTLHKSPSDYSLYFIGIYDDSIGAYTNQSNPELITRVSALNPINEIGE
ncbi:MAG: nonstructural protein [Microvirus sp.]|nr:MAG: nonstructural protein [Microvirus sp.]